MILITMLIRRDSMSADRRTSTAWVRSSALYLATAWGMPVIKNKLKIVAMDMIME
jgi:hypothetical protein